MQSQRKEAEKNAEMAERQRLEELNAQQIAAAQAASGAVDSAAPNLPIGSPTDVVAAGPVAMDLTAQQGGDAEQTLNRDRERQTYLQSVSRNSDSERGSDTEGYIALPDAAQRERERS